MSPGRWLLLACIVAVLASLVGLLALARPDWFELPEVKTRPEPPPHGFMGVAYRDTPIGLVARSALPNGPADAAGIQPGDVITAIDTLDRPDRESLQAYMNTTRPGQEVEVTLRRDDQLVKVRIKLISFEEAERLKRADDRAP